MEMHNTPNPNLANAMNVPNANPPQPMAPMPKRKKLPKKVMIVVAIVVLLLVLTLFYFATTKKKKTNGSNNAAKTAENTPQDIEFTADNLSKDPTPTTNNESPTPTPQITTTTKILQADKVLDGFVTSNGDANDKVDMKVGRNVDYVARGLVGFDITKIPTGITVKAAQLRLYQYKSEGTPYTTSGEVRIDHVTFGDSIDANDYALPALTGNIATLSTSKRIGWKEADVTNAVKDDFANARSTSLFRVHFSEEVTGGDKTGDFAFFTTADRATANIPQLVIEYY